MKAHSILKVSLPIPQCRAEHWQVVQELERALAEPVQEPDLSRCPQCGGPADNGHDRSIPPNPYFCTKCMAEPYDQTSLELCEVCGWKTLIPGDCCLNCERISPCPNCASLEDQNTELDRKLAELTEAVLRANGIGGE